MASAMTFPTFAAGIKQSFGATKIRGAEMTDDYGNKYRYVYNNSGAILSPGYAVVRDYDASAETVAADTFPHFKVKKPATASLCDLAGIVVQTIAVAGSGMILVQGGYDFVLEEGTVAIAIGDGLKGVDAQWYLVHDTAPGTEPTYKHTVKAMEADSGGAGQGNIKAYVDCL